MNPRAKKSSQSFNKFRKNYFPKVCPQQYTCYQMITPQIPQTQLSIYPHADDLICFQKCLKVKNSLISFLNKNFYEQNILIGISEPTQNQLQLSQGNNIFQIKSLLPLDNKEHQRFANDLNQPKIYLRLSFNISKEQKSFNDVNKTFSNLMFENNLSATLHGINVFQDSINFQVKGFDILQSMLKRLNDQKYKSTKINGENIFSAIVFKSVLCNFGVDFTISDDNLQTFYSSNNSYISLLEKFDLYQIQICKMRITYCLPLCVFSPPNYYPNSLMINKIPKQNVYVAPRFMHLMFLNMNPNAFYYMNQVHKENNIFKNYGANFCNWDSFLRNTTPGIYETDELLIKDIFNAFIKASLFGIECLFKIDDIHYTRTRYFPSISNVYIEVKDFGTNEGSSTLDGSILTGISSSKEEELSESSKETISFKEKIKEGYNLPSFQSQLDTIYKKYPELEELHLGEITYDSYFSILWQPIQTTQPKNVNESIKFVEMKNHELFQVFYGIKSKKDSKGHLLEIKGVIVRNIYGNQINIFENSQMNDTFWFQSQSIFSGKFFSEVDYLNKSTFMNLSDKANSLQL